MRFPWENVTDENPTHYVSYWYIPGGYDYTNAFVVEEPCYSEEEAKLRASEIGENIPEMAIVITAEEYAARKK